MNQDFFAAAKESGLPADLNGNKYAESDRSYRETHDQQAFGYWIAAAIPSITKRQIPL
jgi:hypothetical protein